MTENYLPEATQRGQSPPPGLAEEQGTVGVVKDQASDLSHSSVRRESTWPVLPGSRLRTLRRRPRARAGTYCSRLKAS